MLLIPVLVNRIVLGLTPTTGWYELTAAVTPLEVLLSDPKLDDDKYKEKLDKISVFCSIEEFREYSSPYNSAVLSRAKLNRQITKEEIKDYMGAYLRLILAYPDVWLKGRIKTSIGMTCAISDGKVYVPLLLRGNPLGKDGHLLHSWNEDLRQRTQQYVQIVTDSWQIRSFVLRILTWNTVIPVMLCIVSAFAALFKRSRQWLCILGVPLGQIFVLFLALTQSHQMFAMTYYWPGCILSIIAVKDILFTKRSERYLQ